MTPKEALKMIDVIADEIGVWLFDSLAKEGFYLDDLRNHIKNQEQTNNELEALKKLPTADEVCNAYCDYFHVPLTYNNVTKTFEEIKGGRARGRIIARLFIDKADIPHKLPIHLLLMIGRFYEGLEVKE